MELRAPHRGIFPFTRKDTKGVSKGVPLRYPLGEVTVKVGGANQNDAPSPWKSNKIRFSGDGKQNQFAFLAKTILSRSAVTLPLFITQSFVTNEEISKRTPPLGYAFADFSRKRKVSASVGGTSPQNRKFDVTLLRGSKTLIYSTLNSNFSKFVHFEGWLPAPAPRDYFL